MISTIAGALIEAWEEVRVQRARVVMSLIGVVAAVAALTSVVALGALLAQAEKESMEAWIGRNVTLVFNAEEASPEESADGPGGAGDSGTIEYASPFMIYGPSGPDAVGQNNEREPGEPAPDPVGDKFVQTMRRFDVPFWARSADAFPRYQELNEIQSQGTLHGMPVTPDFGPWGDAASAEMKAVDPLYATIFRFTMLQGRWLAPEDANQHVIPMVINEPMWRALGMPRIGHLTLKTSGELEGTYRVVGVVKTADAWDSPRGYIHYDAWRGITPSISPGQVQMRVWVGEQDPADISQSLVTAISANLGDGYQVHASGGEDFHRVDDSQKTISYVIMAIGTMVIALGALGLLNVAIVTVRQRIREIGIRRAVGASARRIFFAVFMESVVATFVAGVIGVIIAVIVIRVVPWQAVHIFIQDDPAFPMGAALAGIGIATGVGALCGVIPAFLALKVRPIDAIRY